jgi:TonB family protein
MFSQLLNRNRRGETALGVSVALHCVLLAWLIHPPRPIFIAPSSTRAGVNGTGSTSIYFAAKAGAAEDQSVQAKDRLTYVRTEKAKTRKKDRRLTKLPEPDAPNKSVVASSAPPAGSEYGSSLTGPTSGQEVRPALRVAGSEPRVDSNDFSGLEGNVVIEITINERGDIVQKTLLTSLSPAVDQKVLAALEDWRFLPATRDGVAIPSKEDVYYHFPVRR